MEGSTGGGLRGTHVTMFAFACSPNRGSEDGVGMEFASALAMLVSRRPDISGRLITQSCLVPEIEAELAARRLQGYITVKGYPSLRWARRSRNSTVHRLSYLTWLPSAAAGMISHTERHSRSVIHHVSYATYALPTALLFARRGVRRVLGPADSSSYNLHSGRRVGVWQRLRTTAQKVLARANFRSSDLVIFQNDMALDAWVADVPEARVEPNVVVDGAIIGSARAAEWEAVETLHGRVRLRDVHGYATMGRHIPTKRYDVAIRAFSLAARPGEKLWVMGDGPLTGNLKRLSAELGLADRVFFLGHVGRSDALRILARTSALIHPAAAEAAGWAVAEAQSLGVPPVVVRGTGADTVIKMGDLGEIAEHADPQEVAAAVVRAREYSGPGTSRWLDVRIPRLLSDWYLVRSPADTDWGGAVKGPLR